MSHSFFPSCVNLLLNDTTSHRTRLKCRACPYLMDFVGSKIRSAPLNPLDVNFISNEGDTMAFVNKTEAICEKCGHNQAYFNEIQIRSADEPATLFYQCINCKHQWREG